LLPLSCCPHSAQNLESAGISLPHLPHLTVPFCSLFPQLRQNLAPWGFGVLHFGHATVPATGGTATAGAPAGGAVPPWRIASTIMYPAPKPAPTPTPAAAAPPAGLEAASRIAWPAW